MRRFEFSDGSADKFWSIGVEESTVAVHYGRIGTNGQRKEKAYASPTAASADAEKQIAAKVKKGYAEVGPVAAPAPATPAASATADSAPDPATASAPDVPSGRSGDSAEATPTDYGFVLTRTEIAAAGGAPLESYAVPDAPYADNAEAETAIEARIAEREVETGMRWWHKGDFPLPPFDGIPDARTAMVWRGLATQHQPEIRVGAQVALQGPEEALRELAKPTPPEFAWVVRALVVPQLSEATRAHGREQAQRTERVERLWWSALFADAGEHAAFVDALSESTFFKRHPHGTDVSIHFDLLRTAAVGLPDAAAREALWDRVVAPSSNHASTYDSYLGERNGSPAGIDLALFGARAFDHWVEYALRESDAGRASWYVGMLAPRVAGPAAVPAFLRLTRSKAALAAREWLFAHGDVVAAYAGRLTAAEASALADLVPALVAAGHSTFAHPAAVAAAARAAELAALPGFAETDWWAEALIAEQAAIVVRGSAKLPRKLPAFVDHLTVVVDGARLSPEQTVRVVTSAANSGNEPGGAARPLIAAVRDHMSEADRDRVGQAILREWLATGAPSNANGLFFASGFFGARDYVAELAPLVRAWPGESQHKRAVAGLDVLVATGTDEALSAISSIANKSKFKGVQKAANEAMELLAAQRGLSTEELQDRLVPDGGLDANGVRILDFGPRQFRVSLGAEGANAGKVIVYALDADGRLDGKPRTALPAANAKDDPDLAAAAKKEFSALKKAVTEVVKIQTVRLEQAMVVGRAWPVADHAAYVRDHPILGGLIRGLVWAVDTPERDQQVLVRVNEERAYVDVEDEPVEPAATAQVYLAHPLFLAEQEVEGWREVLADYALVPPIEQLERATYALPGSQTGTELAALPAGSVHPGSLLSTLERLGWVRGTPKDGGAIVELFLPFPRHGVEAVLDVTGLYASAIADSPDQQVNHAWLVQTQPGENHREWFDHGRAPLVAWSDADPVVVSEVRRSLALLAEKMTA